MAEFRVEVPDDKVARIKEMARELVDSNIVSARQTAAFTGLVIACAPAIGRSARFYTRMAVAWCQSLGEMPKWVKEEISFWITRSEEFSGQPIKTFSLYPGVLCVFRFWQKSNWCCGEGSRVRLY